MLGGGADMLRAILAAIACYIVLFMVTAVVFTVAWLALGSSFAFEEGTTEVTAGWLVVATIIGVIAAVVGGLVAAVVGGRQCRRAVTILVGIVLVLGLLEAVYHMTSGGQEADEVASAPEPAGAGEEELPFWEAASQAEQPLWYTVALPFVGAAAVMLGGRLAPSRGSADNS
jgi:hypothetical protein